MPLQVSYKLIKLVNIRYWGPVVVWMVVIFLLSSRQRVEVSSEYIVNFIFFKTLHVLEYAALYILSYRAFRNTNAWRLQTDWALAAFLLTLSYAAIDEIHQNFVPTREGKVRDVIIDAIGGGAAWYLIAKYLPKAPKKLQKWAKIWQLI